MPPTALLTKAELLYKENKMREAAAAFTQAQDALVEVAAAPEMAAANSAVQEAAGQFARHDGTRRGESSRQWRRRWHLRLPTQPSTKPATTKSPTTKPATTKPVVVAKTPVTKPFVNPLKKPVGVRRRRQLHSRRGADAGRQMRQVPRRQEQRHVQHGQLHRLDARGQESIGCHGRRRQGKPDLRSDRIRATCPAAAEKSNWPN